MQGTNKDSVITVRIVPIELVLVTFINGIIESFLERVVVIPRIVVSKISVGRIGIATTSNNYDPTMVLDDVKIQVVPKDAKIPSRINPM